jgi:3-hydroxyisobutyrate dehydrogenase-like beta-hydroxyacid dehydrogenase
MKLFNNSLSMGYAVLCSKALDLGAEAGLPARSFDSAIGSGRMDGGIYQSFFKYVFDRSKNARKLKLRTALEDLT